MYKRQGCTRRWSLASNRFIGKNGKVCGVEVEEVEWLPAKDGGRPTMKPTGKKEVIEADMVLLAMGFLKPEQPTFAENVFVAGDAANGASLVVLSLIHIYFPTSRSYYTITSANSLRKSPIRLSTLSAKSW